jgi:hypothetical protein
MIMKPRNTMRFIAQGLATTFGIAAVAYAGYAVFAWLRYGHPETPKWNRDTDPLLDRFMPVYDVVARHRVWVAAPPATVLSAAGEMELDRSAIVRAIFKTRALILGAEPEKRVLPRGLLAQMKALGWGVLAEVAGREIVMGTATQPWAGNVVFRTLGAEEFAAFDEPGYVKIAWTLRADSAGVRGSVFRTETRAVAIDSTARAKFRRYWALASPGIKVIRRLLDGPLKAEASRRTQSQRDF